MSIYAVVGKTGTGKTNYLVWIAFQYYKKGYDVYSNFYINSSIFDKHLKKKDKKGKIIFWFSLKDLLDIRGGCILIDEAQLYFNSRGWKNLPLKLQYKFQQHRKHIKKGDDGIIRHIDIWACTQSIKRIDTVVRELVAWVYEIERWPDNQTIKPWFYRAKIMDIDEIDKDVKRQRFTSDWVMFRQWLADSYDTYQEIEGFIESQQKQATGAIQAPKSPAC